MAVTDSNSFDLMVATAVPFGLSKSAYTSKGAGSNHSLWRLAGSGGAGAVPPPGAGGIPDKNTLGAMPLLSVSGAQKLYLTNLSPSSANSGALFIGDRLWANSGLNSTLTTAQPINAPALQRATTGEGLLLFAEIYAVTGSPTAATLTVTYTNSDGLAGRTASTSLNASPVVGQFIPILLQDKGLSLVSPIQSATLSASMGAAAPVDFGLTIVRSIGVSPLVASTLVSQGVYSLPALEIDPLACLFQYTYCSASSMGLIGGSYSIGRG